MTTGFRRIGVAAVALGVPLTILVLSIAQGIATGPADPADPPPSDEYAEQHLKESIAAQVEFNTKTFPTLGIDLSTLPRLHFNASYVPEFETVDATVKAVQTIARVKVTGVTFDGTGIATVTARVAETWKGEVTDDVVFTQMGRVDLADDGTVSIVEPELAPLLVPGDDAIVFLMPATPDWSGLPHLVMYTGWYRVRPDGTLDVPEYAAPGVDAFAAKVPSVLRSAVDRALAD